MKRYLVEGQINTYIGSDISLSKQFIVDNSFNEEDIRQKFFELNRSKMSHEDTLSITRVEEQSIGENGETLFLQTLEVFELGGWESYADVCKFFEEWRRGGDSY